MRFLLTFTLLCYAASTCISAVPDDDHTVLNVVGTNLAKLAPFNEAEFSPCCVALSNTPAAPHFPKLANFRRKTRTIDILTIEGHAIPQSILLSMQYLLDPCDTGSDFAIRVPQCPATPEESSCNRRAYIAFSTRGFTADRSQAGVYAVITSFGSGCGIEQNSYFAMLRRGSEGWKVDWIESVEHSFAAGTCE